MPKLNIKIVNVGQFTSQVTPIAIISFKSISIIGVRVVKSGPIFFSLIPRIRTP